MCELPCVNGAAERHIRSYPVLTVKTERFSLDAQMPEITPPLRAATAAAKRKQIMEGASHVFGELGYERASVDMIALRAGVSKATVYSHFQDKKRLFVACVLDEADAMRAELEACLAGSPAGDVKDALQAIGERIMTVFLSPPVAALYRQTIAESARFPEIGRMVFEGGPRVLQEAIAAHLRRWHDRGVLRIPDLRTAAIQFLALCQGDLAVRSRLAVLSHPAGALVRETVEAAVETFVRAYRP
jgi:AcrR family transcriptional regulator